ncbi:hypothetical protein ACHAXS_008145 [Conticribra weissflogii]
MIFFIKMENDKLNHHHLAENAALENSQFNETLSLDGSFAESLRNFMDHFKDDKSAGASTTGLLSGSPTISDLFGEMSTNAEADSNENDSAPGKNGGKTCTADVGINGHDNDGAIDGNHRLVHKSNSTEIYRFTKKTINVDVGIKVIADESMPLIQQYEKLRREQNISKFLPSAVRRRHVLNLSKFINGRPGLWFEWESGTTLEAWLQAADRSNDGQTKSDRLNAAMAVAQTLSTFHENGVFCRKLSPEDIVLDIKEGTYVATFIDLSEAVILEDVVSVPAPTTDDKSQLNGETSKWRSEDLKTMGRTFIRIFQRNSIGVDEGKGGQSFKILDEDEGEDHQFDKNHSHRKRGKVSVPGEGLSDRENGQDLPIYLRTLISSLILSGHESSSTTYTSAKDVFNDLKKIAANNSVNQQQQHDVGELTAFRIGRRLPSEGDFFYGRQVPLSMLHNFFDSVVGIHDCSPMMATISGCAGSGKSTLVDHAKTRLKDKNGYMIQGKFDKFSRPDSVLVSAIDAFFADIRGKSGSNEVLNAMMLRIRAKVGCDTAFFEAIPNLWAFLNDTDNETSLNTFSDSKVIGEALLTNLDIGFCRLIGAMSCKESPIVLFLDDLHWADQATLDLIRTLMLDPSIRHFGFLGSYRDSEVDIKQALFQKLQSIQDQGVDLTSIHIGPIERECVNDMISDALCIPPSLCLPLSTVVHQKAGGIILFVLRFLTSLRDEGLLCFSMTSRQWEWDLNKIKSKAITQDVVLHTSLQMNSLSQTMQVGLMSAACLGSVFDAEVLEKAIDDREFGIESFVDTCKDGGFIQEMESDTRKYMWTHDQIHQAAYELIPPSRRESFHFGLGLRLYLRTTALKMKSDLLYFIVDNLNKGLKLDLSQSQLTQIAHLNLQGKESIFSCLLFC